jgi:hypothetical protein
MPIANEASCSDDERRLRGRKAYPAPMQRKTILTLGGLIIGVAAAAFALRACYCVFVNKEDQSAADRIVAALDAYRAAKGGYPPSLDALVPRYLQALPAPRPFGSIGYVALEGGRGCLVGYFTHGDFLEEYDCNAKTWESAEYNDSRLIKANAAQWLRGPRP